MGILDRFVHKTILISFLESDCSGLIFRIVSFLVMIQQRVYQGGTRKLPLQWWCRRHRRGTTLSLPMWYVYYLLNYLYVYSELDTCSRIHMWQVCYLMFGSSAQYITTCNKYLLNTYLHMTSFVPDIYLLPQCEYS